VVYAGPTLTASTICRVDLPPGGGIATSTVLVAEPGIHEWTVTGGQVLYSTDAGTFQYDPGTGQTTTLSSEPLSIQAITY